MKAYKIEINQKKPYEIPNGSQQVKFLVPNHGGEPQLMVDGVHNDGRDTTIYKEESYEILEALDPDSKRPMVFMVKTSDAEFFSQLTKGIEGIIAKRAEQRKKQLELQHEKAGWHDDEFGVYYVPPKDVKNMLKDTNWTIKVQRKNIFVRIWQYIQNVSL